MFGKRFICFAMCVVTCYMSTADAGIYYPPKATCLTKGGMCVSKGDCPLAKLEHTPGLCTSGQQECCYGLPTSATGCHAQGGECFELSYWCSTETAADDCARGQHCCVLMT